MRPKTTTLTTKDPTAGPYVDRGKEPGDVILDWQVPWFDEQFLPSCTAIQHCTPDARYEDDRRVIISSLVKSSYFFGIKPGSYLIWFDTLEEVGPFLWRL
ncbi:hypothetical protein MCOR02_004004 [Pyricularia oryzae]|uniref:Uncharacterized protein n=1 Tax=Pyricularia grisea TaxID=148305 RepID=A0ABQ8NKK8_PYRGI|nr:hypothetical protein MCOR01_005823 [Pyricularia oryzae]KAI6298533.1 hypothetical protein MCOR33_005321 [Pyricularia grisea]KAH9435045.1 hypothetical protein MCOR02_004004 [Pyricularia oryzae]KAI6257067.1 hypothetical protein MCOR19_006513 [Pyricularia oryzae]KAI6280600.1 hypothetical protein MCOR26_003673 [Pyricularia oryzae]